MLRISANNILDYEAAGRVAKRTKGTELRLELESRIGVRRVGIKTLYVLSPSEGVKRHSSFHLGPPPPPPPPPKKKNNNKLTNILFMLKDYRLTCFT